MTRPPRSRSTWKSRVLALAIAGTLFTSRQARSDGLDVDVIETIPTSTAVPLSSAACARGSTPPPMGKTGAQAAPSPANPRIAEIPAVPDAARASNLEPSPPTDPPITVLLSLDQPRAAFALAEEASFHLEQARAALDRSRAAHAFAFVDYEPLLDRLTHLTDSVRRTFRPDLTAPHSVAPPARPVWVDGEFWRIGEPKP